MTSELVSCTFLRIQWFLVHALRYNGSYLFSSFLCTPLICLWYDSLDSLSWIKILHFTTLENKLLHSPDSWVPISRSLFPNKRNKRFDISLYRWLTISPELSSVEWLPSLILLVVLLDPMTHRYRCFSLQGFLPSVQGFNDSFPNNLASPLLKFWFP